MIYNYIYIYIYMSDSDDMLAAVLRTIRPMEEAPPEYKHDADPTLLPHLKKLQENIEKTWN